LLNVTNDSWFGNLGEPELHLALTTFRSIETRLPQLRATNTGISALILQDGSLARTGPSNEALHLNWDIPLISSPPTLVLRWGDWFGPLAFLLGVAGLLISARRRS
jgi:apolipoprotein N-acyltransferase